MINHPYIPNLVGLEQFYFLRSIKHIDNILKEQVSFFIIGSIYKNVGKTPQKLEFPILKGIFPRENTLFVLGSVFAS